jgi:hypothetical protein
MQAHHHRPVQRRAASALGEVPEGSAGMCRVAPFPHFALLGLIAVVSAQLSGCAAVAGLSADGVYAAAFRTTIVDPSKLTADEQDKVRKVPVLAASEAPAHIAKGPVKGFACKLLGLSGWRWRPEPSEITGSTPEQAALSQMRIKAVQIGGNAVLLESCTHGDAWDWGNDCFDTWTCIGQSIVIL